MQTTSKARVKVDLVGDNGLKKLFADYEQLELPAFKQSCRELIEASAGKRATKDKFIQAIDKSSTKDQCLKSTTNYTMAGFGLGV